MSVPEAPVDEDAGAVFAEDDVGLSRQSFAVDAIAKSFTPQPFAHDDLRLRVFRPDCRHRSMALNWRKGVSHLSRAAASTLQAKWDKGRILLLRPAM